MNQTETSRWLGELERFLRIPLWKVDALSRGAEASLGGLFSAVDFSDPLYQLLFSDGPVLALDAAMGAYFCLPGDDAAAFYWLAGPVDTARRIAESSHDLPCFSTLGEGEKSGPRKIPCMAIDRFAECAALLTALLTGKRREAPEILRGCVFLGEAQLSDEAWQALLFARREEVSTHLPYEYELALLSCIKAGDLEQLGDQLAQFKQEGTGQLSSDPFRQNLYLMIAVTTLATRFAVEGGLDRETAYTLSDHYIQKADACRDAAEVQTLSLKMLFDFTQRVSRARAPAHYSRPVADAVNYILCHLHYTISLRELAAHCGLTPHYLSNLFHRETGKTITAFLQDERLREAKSLLRHSNLSCQNIASTLAFGSQSYFTKIFRQATGMTPREYRAKYHGTNWEE